MKPDTFQRYFCWTLFIWYSGRIITKSLLSCSHQIWRTFMSSTFSLILSLFVCVCVFLFSSILLYYTQINIRCDALLLTLIINFKFMRLMWSPVQFRQCASGNFSHWIFRRPKLRHILWKQMRCDTLTSDIINILMLKAMQ